VEATLSEEAVTTSVEATLSEEAVTILVEATLSEEAVTTSVEATLSEETVTTSAAAIWATENPRAANQRAKRPKPSETETRRTGHHDERHEEARLRFITF
jgi:hypothetical protein